MLIDGFDADEHGDAAAFPRRFHQVGMFGEIDAALAAPSDFIRFHGLKEFKRVARPADDIVIHENERAAEIERFDFPQNLWNRAAAVRMPEKVGHGAEVAMIRAAARRLDCVRG